MNKKITFSITAALACAALFSGCSIIQEPGDTDVSAETSSETETTTALPTTSTYQSSNTVRYESPADSQRDVSWDITVNKLEIKKYILPAGVAADDYGKRINPEGSGNRFAELEMTLKNTGYGKQSYITYESADIYTELLWDGNSYYPTYITDNPDGYQNEPISSYVDVQVGETATVKIAFEVPKALGESDTPLKYHLFYKNGNGEDGVYIDLR